MASRSSKVSFATEKFIAELIAELDPMRNIIREHPFVAEVERGSFPKEKLRYFVIDQYYIINGDLRNDALLILRSPNDWIRDFFIEAVKGERTVLGFLPALAEAVGIEEKELPQTEPSVLGLAFTNFFASLALYGNPGETASAMTLDFDVWGENCHRMAQALKKHYGFSPEQVKFLDFFYPVSTEFKEATALMMEEYGKTSEEKQRLRRAARLAVEYELLFWDAAYGESSWKR